MAGRESKKETGVTASTPTSSTTPAPSTGKGAVIVEPAAVAAPRSMKTRGASAKKKVPGGASSASVPPTTSSGKSRVTRRELKKLTEMDLEEKEEAPKVFKQEVINPFAMDAAEMAVTPSSLHDDFVNLMKAQGLEKMATEAGIMKDGTLVGVKREWERENKMPTQNNTKRPANDILLSDSSPAYPMPSPAAADGSAAKKRKYVKINKGLRHFSMKVCEKVEEKHVTTYNEVADELVKEFVTMRPNDSVYDEKNIRRRVYDALNVLMAMDIISKERKEIRWRGLPSSVHHDTDLLRTEFAERKKHVEQKRQHLQDLLIQQISMKNLLQRNGKRKDETSNRASSSSSNYQDPTKMGGTSHHGDDGRIFLPFIVVNTSKDTVIQCEMSEDRQDIFFNFSAPFEINDDTEILRRLDLHRCSCISNLHQLIDPSLVPYLPEECLQKQQDHLNNNTQEEEEKEEEEQDEDEEQ